MLDDATPALPELLNIVGLHDQVRVPRARIPVPLVKRLPRSLTKADPEALSFLSNDRYLILGAQEVTRRHALPAFTSEASLLAWADSLAAQRFGATPPSPVRRAFPRYADVGTF